MKKLLKIILVLLGCLAALVLLVMIVGSLFGGCATKNYVNNHSVDLIGRQAHVGHVGVNLFTGHVAIHELNVKEDDGETWFASFDTLDVSVSLLRLLGHRVQVRHLTLAGLDAHIVQDSSWFNFSSIVDRFKGDSLEVEVDTMPSDWVVSMHRIRLAKCRLLYEDRPRQSHIGFHNLSVRVPDFTVGGGERTEGDLTVDLAEGGKLMVQTDYDATSGNFNLSVGLDGFALDQLKPYLMDFSQIEAVEGSVALDLAAQGNFAHLIEAEIAAKVGLDNVNIVDSCQASVASLGQLRLDVGRMVLSQRLFDINSFTIDGLTAKYELFADSSNTFSRLLTTKEGVTDSTAAADETERTADSVEAELVDTLPTPPLQLRVGHLALGNINFTYADHTMPADFVFPVTNLCVEADNVTTAGNNNARVRADLPSGGSLAVDWKGNISDWKQHQDLTLIIKGLHLTDFSPYMVAYFGMPFSDGIFGFTSSNTITNSQLEGKNRIDIFKPTLGEKQEGVKPRLKLPVKAALYVLKDKDGKVLLDVPVKGNVDSPEFNYMKLVWKTLGNLIVKVATSPARLLKGMKEDGEEMFVTIDPEESAFTSEQFYMIDQVAGMAKKDEKVVVIFELQTRPSDDGKKATAVAEERNHALAQHLERLGVNKSQYIIHTAKPDENVAVEGYAIRLKVEN
jgi:hypothetical protein